MTIEKEQKLPKFENIFSLKTKSELNVLTNQLKN